MKQQQEETGEGEENKDLEETCSGITSFPLPFLHLAVLHISRRYRLGEKMLVCGNTSIIPGMHCERY